MGRSWTAVASMLLAVSCGGGGGGSGGGGGGGGGEDPFDPARIPDLSVSAFRVTPPFGTPADGNASVAVEFHLLNSQGLAIQGAVIELEVSGCGNRLEALPPSGADGIIRGTLASTAGGRKTLVARTMSGGVPTEFEARETEFLLIPDDTFFVRVSGSDAASGRSPREAWRTLGHAFANLGPGSTLHIGGGRYPEVPSLELDSSATTPLVISGDRDGIWTADAGPVVIDAGGASFGLRLHRSRQVVVRRLTVSGAVSGLRLEDSGGVRLEDCRLHENDFGLVVSRVQDLTVQDCRISANRFAGIRLSDTERVTLENNLIYANGAEGLLLGAGSEDTLVRFNTFYRNQGNHLSEEGPGGAGSIEGNILSEGGNGALELASASAYVVGANLAWQNFRPGPTETPGETIEGDPFFAEPFGPDGILGGAGNEDDDFRLLPGSSAFDLGSHGARDVVLGSSDSLGARSSRPDGVPDGSGADQPAANLGFHGPVVDPPLRSIGQGGGRLVHAEPGDARLHLAAWERAQIERSETLAGPVLGPDVLYLEERTSPLETCEELLVAQVDTGTRGQIVVRHWDGRRWDDRGLAPFVDDIWRIENVDRRFDVEYEALSGRALFVAAGSDGIARFRVFEGGVWSVEQVVSTSPTDGARVRLVELASRPGSNELALVTLDDRRDLLVTLWDGSRWGSTLRLEANTVFVPSWRPFDVAYESLSGDLLVTWGFTTFAEETRWATLERATGLWRMGQHSSTDAIGAHIVLAPDPASDRIAVTMGEATVNNDLIVSIWNGTDWVHTAELTLAAPNGNRLHEVVWLGRSGVACAVFRDQGRAGSFNVAYFLPTGWRIRPDVVLESVGKAAKVRLTSASDSNHLLGMVLDTQGRLFGLRFDGERFSVLNEGEPMATGLLPRDPGIPFDVVLAAPADG